MDPISSLPPKANKPIGWTRLLCKTAVSSALLYVEANVTKKLFPRQLCSAGPCSVCAPRYFYDARLLARFGSATQAQRVEHTVRTHPQKNASPT